MKAGWVNGLNWLNWGEKSIMHKMLGGDVAQVWIILLSRLARALWIEIPDSSKNNFFKSSRFARALWIEIVISYKGLKVVLVEARESLVD